MKIKVSCLRNISFLAFAALGILISFGSPSVLADTISACTPKPPTIFLLSDDGTDTFATSAAEQTSFTVTVTNNDVGCTPTVFQLETIVPAKWLGSLASASMPLASGQTGATTFTAMPEAAVSPGTFWIGLRTTQDDTHASAFGRSKYVYDKSPPLPVRDLSAVMLRSGKVKLRWTRTVDEGGAGVKEFHIYRSGKLVAKTARSHLLDGSLAVGVEYSYRLKVADLAGNVSASSNVVTAMRNAPDESIAAEPMH